MAFFAQSTPNVGGGMSDFASSGLTEVISVGAWNVASNGEALTGDNAFIPSNLEISIFMGMVTSANPVQVGGKHLAHHLPRQK